jgi:hypothetical protein
MELRATIFYYRDAELSAPHFYLPADKYLLARISDTCQESVLLCRSEGADLVFSLAFHNDTHYVPQIMSHQKFEVGAH